MGAEKPGRTGSAVIVSSDVSCHRRFIVAATCTLSSAQKAGLAHSRGNRAELGRQLDKRVATHKDVVC
jgi:hypothetical protein